MILLVLGLLRENPTATLRTIVFGATTCAGCGATVDSRMPACPSCGMKFG